MSRKTPENVEEISLSSKTSSFYRQNMEEMTARKKMSRKTPRNVEEISLSSKTSSFYRQNVEEMRAQKKMSMKTPQNQEKTSLWKENVPENATKPGETIARDRKCPEKRHKTWRNRRCRRAPRISGRDYLLGNPS